MLYNEMKSIIQGDKYIPLDKSIDIIMGYIYDEDYVNNILRYIENNLYDLSRKTHYSETEIYRDIKPLIKSIRYDLEQIKIDLYLNPYLKETINQEYLKYLDDEYVENIIRKIDNKDAYIY